MKTPLYFADQDRTLLFSSTAIEFLGNFPGLRLEKDGWSLRIANQKKWDDPVTAVFLGHLSASNLHLSVAKGITAKLDLVHLLEASQGAIGLFIRLEENARLELTDVFVGNKAAHLVVNRSFELGTGSGLKLSTGLVSRGTAFMKDDMNLNGVGSVFSAQLLAVAGDTDQFDAVQTIRHAKPETASDITNLLVSAGTSKMHVDVTGTIAKGNYKASCHQINRGIILGESGIISVEPKLVIDEYDVDAGHGCAIGEINADELYYLLSRGLDEATAKKLIISGYLAPLYGRIANPGFLKRLSKSIEQKLKGANL